MAKIGTVIGGKYELIAEIGHGGMSTVYLALDRRLNKQWAVKEAIRKPGSNSNIYELTPIAEANLLKSLDHPNIVRIVDIIEHGGYIYIVEDFIEGKSLAEEVKRGPSKPDDVVNWGVQICEIFEYLHTRTPSIIYRDMKPANVQLQPDRKKIKLLDFGIAKTYKPQNISDTVNLGTRGYAAPEQFDVKRQSDARTDIYSLGITLRALLMGKTPYDLEFYDDITKMNPQVTDGLIKVIKKATDQNPNNRYQNATEFKNALTHYHDRDEAVIRLRKRKLNSFRALLASSIALIMIGTILLPVSAAVKTSSYTQQVKEKHFSDAVQIDPKRPLAYEKLLEQYNKDTGNTQEIKFLSEKFLSDDFNYRNIDVNRYHDEKAQFALKIALLLESKDTDINLDIANCSKPYYQDLAYDFSEPDKPINEKTDMEAELKNENNPYKVIGKIKLYYCSVYEFCFSGDPKGTLSKDDLEKNFNYICKYLENNKDFLNNAEGVDAALKNYGNKNNSVNSSAYEYMCFSQWQCLIDNRNKVVLMRESNKAKWYFDNCVNTSSEYISKQITIETAEKNIINDKN